MAGSDKKLEILEDELKLLKGEVKRTLVDLRAFVMREDSPLSERMTQIRTPSSRESADRAPVLEIPQVQASTGSSDSERRVDALEDELRAVRRERNDAQPAPQPTPMPQGQFPPMGMGYPPPGAMPYPGPQPQPYQGPVQVPPQQIEAPVEMKRQMPAEDEREEYVDEENLSSPDSQRSENVEMEKRPREDRPRDERPRVETRRRPPQTRGMVNRSGGQIDRRKGRGMNEDGARTSDRWDRDRSPRGNGDSGTGSTGGRRLRSENGNGHHDRMVAYREYDYEDGYEDDWGPSYSGDGPSGREVAIGPDFLDVNLMANLVRWAKQARKRMGYEQLMDLLELYFRSGHHSRDMKDTIMYVCSMAEDPVPDEPDPTQEGVDLIHQLHGILVGGVSITYRPRARSGDGDRGSE